MTDTALASAIRFHENLPAAEDTDFVIRAAFAGTRFVMAETPGVSGATSVIRTAFGGTALQPACATWIEGLRPQIPAKAYYGCLGWAYAKYMALLDRKTAFRLYAAAVAHGCYRPGLAAIIFLQIFLSDGLYRRVADAAIAWLGAGWQGRRVNRQLRPPRLFSAP